MKIAVGSDGKSNLTDTVVAELKKLGHEIELFGALKQDSALWPFVAEQVAKGVASGKYDQGLLFCWTGTGISMAANKVPGARAALCWDVETARGARVWNDANILAMSLRATSEELAKEMLKVWFSTQPSRESDDVKSIEHLGVLDSKR